MQTGIAHLAMVGELYTRLGYDNIIGRTNLDTDATTDAVAVDGVRECSVFLKKMLSQFFVIHSHIFLCLLRNFHFNGLSGSDVG